MKKNIKIIIIISFIIIIILGFFISKENNVPEENNTSNNDTNNENDEYGLKEFNDCLGESGLKIYGVEWCPACNALVETLGGKEATESIYVECSVEQQRCMDEAKTEYVPEIQINGELYQGQRSINALANVTGCEIPN